MADINDVAGIKAKIAAAKTLGQKQRVFSEMVGMLLTWIYTQPDLAVSLGEALRSEAQANANAANGKGISNSLHLSKLAIDLNLFIKGVYQAGTPAYKPLGDYWKSIGGSWGGDFKSRPDGNHFSLEHNGVR